MDNTTFADIYKLFLNSIHDYRITNLFSQTDTTPGDDLMESFLLKSIPRFYNCVKDISNADLTNLTFNVSLDLNEKLILTNLMIIAWADWCISDITQMQLTLDD
jgi:hypothetical protein